MLPAIAMLAVFLLLGIPACIVGITWSALRGNFRLMYAWGMGIMPLRSQAPWSTQTCRTRTTPAP